MTSKIKRGSIGEAIGHVEVIEDDFERTIERLFLAKVEHENAARNECAEWAGLLWNASYGAEVHR